MEVHDYAELLRVCPVALLFERGDGKVSESGTPPPPKISKRLEGLERLSPTGRNPKP